MMPVLRRSGLPSALLTLILLALSTTAHANDLVSKYAPVIVQYQDRLPFYDIITNVDFDGNFDGADNVANAASYPLNAHVYGDVIAETQNAYYILYIFYHPKDYDTQVREFFFESASHDNDLEGAMIAVDKTNGKVIALETWFHNLFMQSTYSPKALGTQSIDGKLHTEDETHVVLAIESKGHGVLAFQHIDEADLSKTPHLIYRHGDHADNVKAISGEFVNYTLLSLKPFLDNAMGPFGQGYFFSEAGDFGLPKKIGKFMTGSFKGTTSWARPKPPWSWADKRDTLRYGAWFFHPAYSFYKHFGFPQATPYIHNLPAEQITGWSDAELDTWAQDNRDRDFFAHTKRSQFDKWRQSIKKTIYKWMEYLFFEFG